MKRLFIAGCFLIAAVALAQDHPNDARGFDPSKVYDSHDIDTINSFNGNLTVRVPIGPVYHANALVKYQFTLVYNSHIWHYDEQTDPDTGVVSYIASPKKTNAGLGWNLSLGRLIANDDTGSDTNSLYPVYEAPDGSQHAFYAELHCQGPSDVQCFSPATATGYTRDSSYLRMRSTGTTAQPEKQIDFPDDTTQVFWLFDPTTWARANCGTNGNNCPNAVWRPVQIKSALANNVSVAYSSNAQYSEIWTVTDADRTTSAFFKATGNPPLSTQPLILDHIDLPATGGRTATYSLTSGQTALPAPSSAGRISVFLLESVSLPPGDSGSQATYSMMDGQVPAYKNYGDASQTGPDWSGALYKLTLPTGGAISWDYSTTSFDPPGGIGKSPGLIRPVVVTQRQTFPPGSSTAEGTWQYGRLFGRISCIVGGGGRSFKRQLTSWVMRPRTTDPATGTQDPQYAAVSYFSLCDPENDVCTDNPEGWQGAEYGLPFTRYATRVVSPDYANVTRYLSSELVKNFSPPSSTMNLQGSISGAGTTPPPTIVSSNYVTYELDEETQNCCENPHDHNARVSSTATTYPLDTGCSGACFKAANLFHIDGFVQYQQTPTTSNF